MGHDERVGPDRNIQALGLPFTAEFLQNPRWQRTVAYVFAAVDPRHHRYFVKRRTDRLRDLRWSAKRGSTHYDDTARCVANHRFRNASNDEPSDPCHSAGSDHEKVRMEL